jgi:hypothetical protein
MKEITISEKDFINLLLDLQVEIVHGKIRSAEEFKKLLEEIKK